MSKEFEATKLDKKQFVGALFLEEALPEDFLKNAPDKTALLSLASSFARLPALADRISDRQTRTYVRSISAFDLCNIALKMNSHYIDSAFSHANGSREFRRDNNSSELWLRRRALAADLVHFLRNNSTRLDCTMLPLVI